jgi:hypothetical protein
MTCSIRGTRAKKVESQQFAAQERKLPAAGSAGINLNLTTKIRLLPGAKLKVHAHLRPAWRSQACSGHRGRGERRIA